MSTNELRQAYQAVFLREFRGEITREQRIAMILALRPATKLSFERRDAVANEAAALAIEITEEVHTSQGGRWQ